MALNITGIIDALVSRAEELGVFAQVNGHEPKSAPSTGAVCSIWVAGMAPVESSGLASVSIRVMLQCRIQMPMLTEPQDGIDPEVTRAADLLFTALIGGFTLAGVARHVDVLGADGEGLRAEAGYLNQDGRLFRVMDVFVPVIINDVHAEVA